jgi:hypothetical protein
MSKIRKKIMKMESGKKKTNVEKRSQKENK